MRANTRVSHYQVGRRLGRGGMGEVYEALDIALGRRVALKFVAPELAADAEVLRRFEREARSVALLSHPHIATLYAFERDGNDTFIAMELVGGGSLRERLRQGPLPVAEALGIARDVASALALAHRRGVFHRDVKPENLMFDEDGVVKLMDFGLAHATQASRMTMPGSALGTAAYMPPESIREGAGAPGDVFALGVTLHELLAGKLPFAGDNPIALLYTSANEPPTLLRAARPDAPQAAEDLVSRMLIKTPMDRPDAAMVARELAAMTGVRAPIVAGDDTDPREARASMGVGTTDGNLVPGRETPRGPRAPQPTADAGTTRSRMVGISIVAAILVALLAWLLPGLLRERSAARHQQATRLTDEGVDSLKSGNLAAGEALFDTALKLSPGHGNASVSLAQALQARGESARAAQILRGVLTRHVSDRRLLAQTRDALAEIDMAEGNWGGAVESLERAFTLDSSGVRAYNQLAYALIRAGRPSEAISLLIRAIERFPARAVLHKNLGLAALAMGDARTGMQEADLALGIDASFAPAMALRARAQARLGDRAGARVEWSRYLALAPTPADSAETANDLIQRGVLR